MHSDKRQYVFNKDFLITSADVDFEGKTKVSSLTNILIQAAWQHAEQLGWGVDDLAKHNLAWVLSSIRIKIFDYPTWRQTIQCETWPKGISRLFYLRDFNIYDSDNKLLASATSNWILIDIERRRPKLHNLDDEAIKKNSGKHAIEEEITPVKFDGEIESSYEYTVKYSDIDINQHLTTTRYIDIMFDTFSPEQIGNCRAREVKLSFLKEVTYAQNIRMQRHGLCNDNGVKFQLISEKQEKPCFLAELLF